MANRLAQLMAFILIWGTLCFSSAGTFDWLRAWIYLVLLVGGLTISALVVFTTNPQVIVERGKIRADTKFLDKIIIGVYSLLLLVTPVVAGFDAERFRWSSMPFAYVYLGGALYTVSMIPPVWAMAVNPYLETGVRVQQDRGQFAITSGPYRFVRHPMYVGVIVNQFATPLILGSMWAYVPALAIAVLFIVRTALEDRTLLNERPGYSEFAEVTRYRLLPGVW
jgi:protein-S-isoprenylcysteine O-methyltransferase Ste14